MGSRSASARLTSRAAVSRAHLGLLLFALVLPPACHAPPDPEAIADEVDELCRKRCPLITDCLSDPVPETLEACIDECIDFPGYYRHSGCGTASRAVLRCQSELTCDELSLSWNAPLDAEVPCVEERYNWSTCDPDEP